MVAVGLGRTKGAQIAHAYGLDRSVPSIAKKLVEILPDQKVLKMALQGMQKERPRIIHIRNTLQLEEFGVSNFLWETGVKSNSLTEICKYRLHFDKQGKLIRINEICKTGIRDINCSPK